MALNGLTGKMSMESVLKICEESEEESEADLHRAKICVTVPIHFPIKHRQR